MNNETWMSPLTSSNAIALSDSWITRTISHMTSARPCSRSSLVAWMCCNSATTAACSCVSDGDERPAGDGGVGDDDDDDDAVCGGTKRFGSEWVATNGLVWLGLAVCDDTLMVCGEPGRGERLRAL